ncbi:MAG: M24 family metallopeptidase [Armatimonadota bacterium]|nr:M24 family metallopeptidase [Armatimonadota bacterium]
MTKESLFPDKREIAEKERRVKEFMELKGLDALVLTTQSNFAWFTCGADNRVANATEIGVASVVITKDSKYIVCDNIEYPRIFDEEIGDQGFKFKTYNWWESNLADEISKLTSGTVGADTVIAGTKLVAGDIPPLRYSLTEQEIERYRWLGINTAECMYEACIEVRPGMTEHQIAALLGGKLIDRGIIPNLILIAADERISKYRHPIPTENTLEKYAMLVTCARKWGLILSMTRIVHFGSISPELRHKHDAVMQVDAELIGATRPGARVDFIFGKAIEAYRRTGFQNEWHFHHQGGPTGYVGRDYRARPGVAGIVETNQAFAWNPSIAGTKSEDTIIALTSHTEIISAHKDWPTKTIEINGAKIERPDIMEM